MNNMEMEKNMDTLNFGGNKMGYTNYNVKTIKNNAQMKIKFKRTSEDSYEMRLKKDSNISAQDNISMINNRYYTIFLIDKNNENLLSTYKDELIASFDNNEIEYFMEANIKSLKIIGSFDLEYWNFRPIKHIFKSDTIFDDALLCEKTDTGISLYNIKRFNYDDYIIKTQQIQPVEMEIIKPESKPKNTKNYSDACLTIISSLIVNGRIANGYKDLMGEISSAELNQVKEIVAKALASIDEESMYTLSSIINKIL